MEGQGRVLSIGEEVKDRLQGSGFFGAQRRLRPAPAKRAPSAAGSGRAGPGGWDSSDSVGRKRDGILESLGF